MQTTDVLAAFLRSLGMPNEVIPAALAERAARFRSLLAGRRVLIVLDNARTAEQVRPLLPGSGSCLVLVTSRDLLTGLVAADGARRVTLDVLSTDESIDLLSAVLGDRVLDEPAAGGELCRWGAHLPLALRIIGMLALDRPHTPLAELARELADEHSRLDLLDRAGPDHVSVRVVFSWSYQQLPPEAARCFRLLGGCPGQDFPLVTIAQLLGCGEAAVRQPVEILRRANLIESAPEGRLRMHDLLRTYAASLAATDELEQSLQRLFDYYARRATAVLDGNGDHRLGMDWLAAELPNLVAAFELAAGNGWDTDIGRLHTIITRYLKTVPEISSATSHPGDIPRTLRNLDYSTRLFGTIDPGRRDRLRLEQAEALLYAGLSDEASRQLHELAAATGQAANGRMADIQLLQATAALIEEDFVRAERRSAVAQRLFEQSDNPVRAGLAALLKLRAITARAMDDSKVLRKAARQATQTANQLAGLGLRSESMIAQLLGLRTALRRGEQPGADHLREILQPQQISSVDHLILLRLVRTEHAAAQGNRDGALAQAHHGLIELQRHRSWTSGLELIGGTLSYGLDLAERALDLLVTAAEPATLFHWLELIRNSAFRYQPPPDDPTIDTRVAEIRRLTQILDHARTANTIPRDARQHTALNQAALRYATIPESMALTEPPRQGHRVSAALDHRILVTFLVHADTVAAIVIRDGEFRFIDICPAHEVWELARQLHADINALAPDDLVEPLAKVVTASARRRAARLDELLLAPLANLLADRELVIIPNTGLYPVVWPALPSLIGRAITVTPSATTWLTGHGQPPRWRGRPVAVVGPGMPAAISDPNVFARHHPAARIMYSDSATVGAVLNALNDAPIAHLAAHGTHEPSNAAFSRLELADGGLPGHELHRLTQPPGHVILAACELALSNIRRHDEPLGFAGALLSAGTRTVTAATNRVGDKTTAQALTEYHRALASGKSPASALAAVTAADPLRRPFLCLGWG